MLRFSTYVFSVVLVSIEKIYQTLERVFQHISKYLEVRQKYSAACRIFNSLLRVRKCDETLSLVFDVLLHTLFHMLTNKLYHSRLGNMDKFNM